MGIKGLWKILESVRRTVDLEHFRGKRIAIDMNIWLHQALKSKAKGNHNLHLTILFRRICKLLFYGIRPVFVFDGAVPALKRAIMANRRAQRSLAQERSLKARNRLLKRLFHRLAERAAKSEEPSKELTAEFVARFNSTVAIRRAETDAELFAPKSDPVEIKPSSKVVQLELEQTTALQLAHDFVDNCSEVDIHSDAFNALPVQAQLQVVLLLRESNAQVISNSGQSGSTFSHDQIKRLVMKRELSRKQAEIEAQMNSALVKSVLPAELPSSGEDVQVIAHRIASQDQGHAILLKRRSSKERMDEMRKRLDRLINGATDQPQVEDSKTMIEPSEEKTDSFTKGGEETTQQSFDSDATVDLEWFATSIASHASLQSVEGEIDTKFSLPEVEQPENDSEVSQTHSHEDTTESIDKSREKSDVKPKINKSMEELCVSASGTPNRPEIDNSTDEEASEIPPKHTIDKSIESNFEKGDKPETDESSTDSDEFTDVEDAVHPPSPLPPPPDIDSMILSQLVKDGIQAVDVPPAEDISDVVGSSSDDEDDEEEEVENGLESPPKTTLTNFLGHSASFGGEGGDEDDFEIDDEVLRAEADRLERLSEETTSDCVAEAQRLVELFGFPQLTSPEEAEAQCCRLQQLGLVDVVASDDSDVWVFGASLVCRHLFGGKDTVSKQTSIYSITDAEEQLGLNRQQFIRLALLCGGDYTAGIDKIGPIRALEVLAAFHAPSSAPSDVDCIVEPLEAFRRCCEVKADPKWRNISIPADFPSRAVVDGYLKPRVQEPTEFQWKAPNMTLLVKYAREKLGWSKQMSEGTLASVIGRFKATIESTISRNQEITNFFPRVHNVAKPSTRLNEATTRLRYANELRDLPELTSDWPEAAEVVSEPITSMKRKSDEGGKRGRTPGGKKRRGK